VLGQDAQGSVTLAARASQHGNQSGHSGTGGGRNQDGLERFVLDVADGTVTGASDLVTHVLAGVARLFDAAAGDFVDAPGMASFI
jgi:hypothetical protein